MPQMTTIIPGFLIVVGGLFGGVIASNFAKLVILAKLAQYHRNSLKFGGDDYALVKDNKVNFAKIVPGCECYLWAVVAGLAFPYISVEYPYPASLLIILAMSVLIVMSFVDFAVRIAPFELTVVLYLFAGCYAFVTYSFQACVAVLVLALLCFVVLKTLNCLATFKGGDVLIGNGDVRVIPACIIMLGFGGSITMLLVTAILPLLWMFMKWVAGVKTSVKDRIALIPYLSLGFIAGFSNGAFSGLAIGGF